MRAGCRPFSGDAFALQSLCSDGGGGGGGVELGLQRRDLFRLGFGSGFGGAAVEPFPCRFAVDQFVVFAAIGRGVDDGGALSGGHWADAAARRGYEGTFDRRRRAIGHQKRDQSLADLQLGDGSADIDTGVGAKGFGRRFDGTLVARGEGAQRVLDAVAELPRDRFGNVDGVLTDEIDPDTFGAHQPHDLLHLVEQRFGGFVEQQMRLVEKEHQLGLFGVADFGEGAEQVRQQPEQESGVKPRALHQAVGSEDVDAAAPVAIDANEIGDVERWLPEEIVGALRVELEQLPLDAADAGLCHIAVFGAELGGIIGAERQHRLQVF